MENENEKEVILPTTADELKSQIDEAVKIAVEKATAELTKQHNDQMANLRKSDADKLDRAVKEATENAKLSTEQLEKKKSDELLASQKQELDELRQYKKVAELSKKLADNDLPNFFSNDSRLLNAESDKVDEVIETIKKEYNAILPKGATVDTNVKGNGGKEPKTTDRFAEFRNMR